MKIKCCDAGCPLHAQRARTEPSAVDHIWALSSRPCSCEEDEELALSSLARIEYAGQQLELGIKPSTHWVSADLDVLGSLVQDRNRFVCMQLVTMAKEQHAKASAAAAAGDTAALHAARFTFLATASTSGGHIVAAALFYPRAASKDGAAGLPHMYVELICCNCPGRGYGTLLLQHIEHFVVASCDAVSAGFFGGSSAALTPAVPAAAAPAAAAPAAAAAAPTASSAGDDTMESDDDALIDIVSDGASTASKSSAYLPASEVAAAAVATTAAAPPGGPLLLPVLLNGSSLPVTTTDVLGLDCCSGCGASCSLGSCSSGRPAAPEGLPGAVVAAAATGARQVAGTAACLAAAAAAAAARRIRGVKLLSVGGAREFYSKMGYAAPDACHEMFKAL